MGQTPIRQIPYPEASEAADVPTDMKEMADKLDTFGYVPVGAMMLWALAGAPDANWLLCDGSPVPVGYPLLRALMVNTPNLQGRVIVGVGTLAGGSTYGVGALGGEERHSLLATESGMVGHDHSTYTSGRADGVTGNHDHDGATTGQVLAGSGGEGLIGFLSGGPGNFFGVKQLVVGVDTNPSGTPDHRHVVTGAPAANATNPHENRQPYVALNYIIRGK